MVPLQGRVYFYILPVCALALSDSLPPSAFSLLNDAETNVTAPLNLTHAKKLVHLLNPMANKEHKIQSRPLVPSPTTPSIMTPKPLYQ